jgi:hypothetical protein
MSRTQYRQGDVLIVATTRTSIPAGTTTVDRDRGRIVLAYGEVTGHAHAIDAPTVTMVVDPATGRRWLLAPDGAVVAHEEHTWIDLPPGTYEVKQQREYTPEAIRNVAD